jgi:lipopolysaccharide/colanic/teichoic acid biosynthesis glycosyltransferase
MSIVGPRPERPYFVDQFSGLAQVRGPRGDTPISDRARFDNRHLENRSIWCRGGGR